MRQWNVTPLTENILKGNSVFSYIKNQMSKLEQLPWLFLTGCYLNCFLEAGLLRIAPIGKVPLLFFHKVIFPFFPPQPTPKALFVLFKVFLALKYNGLKQLKADATNGVLELEAKLSSDTGELWRATWGNPSRCNTRFELQVSVQLL